MGVGHSTVRLYREPYWTPPTERDVVPKYDDADAEAHPVRSLLIFFGGIMFLGTLFGSCGL